MAEPPILLTTRQMAEFAARGFLRFDGLVPDSINQRFLGEARENEIPVVAAGTPLDAAYAPGSTLRALVELPLVRGAIESLVGPGCRFDHHFLHLAHVPETFEKHGVRQSSFTFRTRSPARWAGPGCCPAVTCGS